MNKRNLIALFICLLAHYGYGQTERLSLQLDKSFYLSGENIWFKVGLLNEDTSQIRSRIAYVELVSPENKLLDRAKLRIADRVASGSFSLPFTTNEGNYLIRVYTLYNLNFEKEGVLNAIVPIFNPLESDITSFNAGDSLDVKKRWDDRSVSLGLGQSQYQPRDTIELSITSSKAISVSVSILDTEVKPHDPVVLDEYSGASSERFVAEKRLSIDGILTDLESGEKITSPVISVYNGESGSFLRARSEEGRVKIPVPEFLGTSTFQVYNLNPYQKAVNQFQLSEIEYDFPGYNNQSKPGMTKEIAQYILKSKKRRKIHELLGMDLFRSISHSKMEKNEVVADYSYEMAKYQNIRTLEEFIDEGVFAAKVKKRKDKTEIRLFNSEDKFTFVDPPWYIVDGIITNDESKVLAIPFKDIRQVNLYTKTSTIKKYFEHFLWRNGVIEVITTDVKYRRQFSDEPNVIVLKGYSQSPDFFGTLPVATQDLPDVRGVIFWMAHLDVETDKKLSLRIPHSNESGNFTIRVVGISADGEMYRNEISYRVSGE